MRHERDLPTAAAASLRFDRAHERGSDPAAALIAAQLGEELPAVIDAVAATLNEERASLRRLAAAGLA